MKGEEIAIVVLWATILFVIGLVAVNALEPLVQAAGQVFAAVVSGGALLLGGILTHTLTQFREQRLSQRQRMQENYAKLLEKVGTIIRDPENLSDDFSTIHLESWVVGSPQVIQKTKELLNATDEGARKAALQALVYAMRADMGLQTTNETLGKVFPPPPADRRKSLPST
jgi:hypothetical protein